MQLAEAEMLADLTDVYDAYASELLKSGIASSGTLGAATLGGKVLGIPRVTLISLPMVWVRGDWMEELGLQAPTTFEELVDIARAFVKNGYAKYGFSGKLEEMIPGLKPLFNAFGSYPSIWLKDENGVQYGSVQPETREALECLAALFKEGLIDPEFAITGDPQTAEKMASGEIGIAINGQWYAPSLTSVKNNNPKAELMAFPIPGVNGGSANVQTTPTLDGIYVVSSECEHPEAVIKLFNLFYKHFLTSKSIEELKLYKSDVGDDHYYSPYQYSAVVTNSAMMHYAQAEKVNYAYANGLDALPDVDAEEREYARQCQEWAAGESNDSGLWGQYYNWGENVGAITNGYIDLLDNGKAVFDVYNLAPTETMLSSWSILQDMEVEVFAKIVMGEADISEFDQYVKDWYNMGGAQIIEELNAR